MTTSHLEIDWTRCDGHGLCSRLLPERIGLDEWGFPILTGEPLSDSDTLVAARLAARNCPALALRVSQKS